MKNVVKTVTVLFLVFCSVSLAAGCKKETPQLVGGYGEERELTADDLAVFELATEEYSDQGFEPLTVSTQVVAGTNYKFYCKVTPASSDGDPAEDSYYAFVTIFKSLNPDENPTVTSIEKAK